MLLQQTLDVLAVTLFSLIIFAILGVQQFGGRFAECTQPGYLTIAACEEAQPSLPPHHHRITSSSPHQHGRRVRGGAAHRSLPHRPPTISRRSSEMS